MAKQKTIFVCGECGYESSGWLGKCPSCSKWNTFYEEKPIASSALRKNTNELKPLRIQDVQLEAEERLKTGIGELDRVLGGGIIKGSMILVGGDPGIGKSTLILQMSDCIRTGQVVLYVSGEESVKQIKMRADRLGVKNPDIVMISETDFVAMEELIAQIKPVLIIVDSIQTMFSAEISSAPGSVSQVRDVTAKLMRIAKGTQTSVIIVGHVTKDGSIAGPRVLEHMVDTVLYFEGERHMTYRILRAVKNRFGSTNEIGIFEMKETGLVEVDNPSTMMLSGKPEEAPGSVVVSSMEGTRPMLIEVQALVCPTAFGMPRRMATGVDYNRVVMLMAVLEKRAGYALHNFDAYVNVVGGLKLDEPACDMGFVCAIASSFKNKAIREGTVFIGEIGLTGEIRGVGQIEKRIIEAERIGFKECIIPTVNYNQVKNLINDKKIFVRGCENIKEVLDLLF